MTLMFGFSILAASGGLVLLLAAVWQRRFSGMAHGFRIMLLLAVAGASLMTAWVLGVWGYEASRRVLFAQTVDELGNVGGVIEAEIHDGIADAVERLRHLADELAPDMARGHRAQVQDTLQIVQRFAPRFLQVTVYDTQGAVLVSSSLTAAVEPPNRIAVAFNLEGKPFTDAYRSPIFHTYVLYLSTPIRGADSVVLGVLSARYDVQADLAHLIAASQFGGSAYTVLATHEGRILAHPDAHRLNDDISGYPAVQQARRGKTGWVLTRNKAGQERLMVYRPLLSPVTLAPHPWVLLAEMDVDEATAPIRALRTQFVLATALLGVASLVLAGQMSFALQRPLAVMLQLVGRVRDGDLTVRSTLQGRDELGRLAAALNEMVGGLQERDRIKEVFGRYVTTQVSEEILRGQLALGGVAKRVTILFSDVRNFTTMAEAMSPEQVVTFLNDYFSEMVEAVFEQQGVLDKFIGDGMLAIFGSLDEASDHPRRAVLAALRMKARLAKLNGERSMVGDLPIAIGIGIHTDTVVVGNIGSHKRLEYTVIGDGVNTCARVEAANKALGTTILMTQTTWEAVRDDVECRPMPTARLKGKVNAPQLYEVVNVRAARQAPSARQDAHEDCQDLRVAPPLGVCSE
jgi:class 3 adenylate cyclase